eukprot:s2818_g7.t1
MDHLISCLASAGGPRAMRAHAMQGVEVLESVGLAAEEAKSADQKVKETPEAEVAVEHPPPASEQKPYMFKRNTLAKQSGVPDVG